ncbi:MULTISPECIES: hypothetical protein [Myxococcus]|nr:MULTISPECIES: hypothetical protein [Myxococcus]NOJ56588.1 hypothetical protein [Myxococcus xanthus]QPM78173.1 hypothetical protein I5Q59_28420 [Myxococcus xanthus]QVW67240.1 hypothetical protein JTM82_33770 [Myxococcus xanthus DZ2]UEO06632.1 hypothetical protein K1515_09020 [Myxococcus xanthus DZ2]UYI13076.1 hypothetical protein N3T43_29025 [Myxococcus xanthus]
MSMKSCCAVLVAALFLGACVATKPSVTYSSFGEARLAEDAAVVQRYEADYERRHPSSTSMTGNQFQIPVASGSSDVKVLVDTFPEGVELVNGSIRTTDGAPHEILGKLSLRASSHGTLPREKLLEEAKQLARAAGGNVVIMSFVGGDQAEANGVVGYVLKSDLEHYNPKKSQSGKLSIEI